LYSDHGTLASRYIIVQSGSFSEDYIVSGLTPGLLYHFTSTATNSIGESEFSPEVSFYAASKPSKP